MDVLQDRRGYIWLATEDGLNRYDGTALQGVPARRRGPRHPARQLHLGRGAGRRGKRVDRHPGRAVPVGPRPPTASCGRTRRASGTSGCSATSPRATACGSARASPACSGWTSPGLLERFVHDDADPGSLADDRVFALYVDGKDRLWVGTEGGLDLRNADGSGFTHQLPREPDAATPQRRARSAPSWPTTWARSGSGPPAAGSSGSTWPAAASSASATTAAVAASLANDDVRALLQDSDGRLWVGTGGGLDLFDPRARHLRPLPPGPARPQQPLRRPRPVAGPGPRRRALGGHAHGRRAQVEPAELAVRPRRAPTPTTPRDWAAAGSRPSRRTGRAGCGSGPTAPASTPWTGRRGDMKAYRHDAANPAGPAQRHGDRAAPRPPRRPLDRHPRRRPGADERGHRLLQVLPRTTRRSPRA